MAVPELSLALQKRMKQSLATQGGDLGQELILIIERALEISSISLDNATFTQETIQLGADGSTSSLGGAGTEYLGTNNLVVGYMRVVEADISLLEAKAPTGFVGTFDFNADSTLLMTANLSVNGVSAINQSVETTSDPTFANLTITSFAANWTNAGRTIADLGIVTTVDLNGGTIDGASIGSSTAASGVFSTLSVEADSIILDSDDPGGFTTTLTQSATSAIVLTLPDVTGTLATLADIAANGDGIYDGSGSLTGATVVTMATNNLQFNSTGVTGLFFIDATNDKIGIGTTSPTNQLQVQGDNYAMSIRNTAGLNHVSLSTSTTDGGRLQLSDLSGTVKAAIGVTFLSADFFDTGLNFGLGTQVPLQKLHIEATSPNIRLSDTDAANDQEVVSNVQFYRGHSTNQVGFIGYTTSANEDLSISNETTNGSVDFFTNSTVRATIDNVGNFGIATAAFGANAVSVFGLATGTAPTSSPGDLFQIYSADHSGAGTAAFHVRDEEGNVVKLFKGAALTSADATATDGTIGTNDTITNNIRIRLNEIEVRLQASGQLT